MDKTEQEIPAQTFQPIRDVLVLQITLPDKTKAGVLIPEAQRLKFATGRDAEDVPVALVVAAGPACRYVRRGDRVIVGGNFHRFRHDGGPELFFANESQVQGIECNAGGDMPAFEVADWETGEVLRFNRPEPQDGPSAGAMARAEGKGETS